MPSGRYIDDNKVHEYLWKRSDGRGVVKIEADALVNYLGVNKFTVSRILSRMVAAGRISQVTKRRYKKGLFRIVDPDEFNSSVSDAETDV